MFKKALFLFFITLSALTLGACDSSSSDDDSTSTRSYMGTQTPGDIWTWDFTTAGGQLLVPQMTPLAIHIQEP